MSEDVDALIVEDKADVAGSYRAILESYGYRVTLATNVDEGRAALRAGVFDVVVLDQNLPGPSGVGDGLDLLEDARLKGGWVIVITGYANDDMIQRAFERGAHDFIEKGAHFLTIFKVKLAQARSLGLARRRSARSAAERAAELFARLDVGTPSERGLTLEDLVATLFTSIEGFVQVGQRIRTPVDEIDLSYRIESRDPFWATFAPYFMVECKNWTGTVGKNELVVFADKVRSRSLGRLAVFVAAGQVSEPLDEKVREYRSHGLHIVVLDRPRLERLVRATSTSEALKLLCDEAYVGRA